jgi:DNA-binding transcriptional ArsR family regulator
MSDDVPYTWPTRELPILKLGVRVAEGRSEMELEEIARELGLEERTVRVALEELRDADYIKVRGAGGMKLYLTGVTERGRVATGSWPSSERLVDELAAALGAAADRESEPDKKRWLRQLADGLTGVAREAVVSEVRLILHRLGVPLT